jgi:hypothetical protein
VGKKKQKDWRTGDPITDRILAERMRRAAMTPRQRTIERNKKLNKKIHKSHKMARWRSTIVTIIATARFGLLRHCTRCKAEQAATVSGDANHPELEVKCTVPKKK